MTAYINIERRDGGWRDRYRAYEVLVNGSKRADLWRGDRKRIEVEPGVVEVYLKIDWAKSRIINLDLRPDSEARLRCSPRSLFTTLYGITFDRNNYVRLEIK